MDNLTPTRRSDNMRAIRSKNSSPERMLRSLVYSLGYRFRLHRKDLPGCPDLVFGARRKLIFMHGCFWHQHPGCREGRIPGSRIDYWRPKLQRNQARDAVNRALLEEQGWQVLVIWECEIKERSRLVRVLKRFLGKR